MKPTPGLPCGVRLTAGLGGAGGTTALALAAETVAELERRATLSIGVVFTTGSVPELSPVQHRFASKTGVAFLAVCVLEPSQNRCSLCAPHRAWCLAAGERPAEGRAATTRLTLSLIAVPKMALPEVVVVLCSTDFPARSSEVNSEQVLLTNAIHLEGSDARTEALDLTEFFVLVTPNV